MSYLVLHPQGLVQCQAYRKDYFRLVSMSSSQKSTKNKPVGKKVGFIILCNEGEHSSRGIVEHLKKRVFERTYDRIWALAE